MSQTLVNDLVSDSGVSGSLGKVAHIALVDETNLRVFARSAPGTARPPGECPAVSIETSADGESWATAIAPMIASDEGSVGYGELPLGHDVRVRWTLDEPCVSTTYWSLRVWVG